MPPEPHARINQPLLVNSRMRFLPVSATYTLPIGSRTMPPGSSTLHLLTILCAYDEVIEPLENTIPPIAVDSTIANVKLTLSIFSRKKQYEHEYKVNQRLLP